MSPSNERNAGTALVIAAILAAALSNWDTLTTHLPDGARSYAQSPLTAIVLALAGVYFLWRAASGAAQMDAHLAIISRAVDEAQNDLRNRIQQAESKLTKVVDEQVINWSPALHKLQEDTEARFRNEFENYSMELRQAYNSYRRRAERGYLGGDDIKKPPPPITPQDI